MWIKEYWIISPKENFVHIFSLNEDDQYKEPKIYLKDDIAKSEVFNDLEIDLNDIFTF
ncbi:Uma2 family endonuclease [Gottschalkia purinilytica]|uniref:Uma2 family endonuclease n=1 Tax=Gottschalkia purinilytica TaxID=1503 RepID=UPI00191105F6